MHAMAGLTMKDVSTISLEPCSDQDSACYQRRKRMKHLSAQYVTQKHTSPVMPRCKMTSNASATSSTYR